MKRRSIHGNGLVAYLSVVGGVVIMSVVSFGVFGQTVRTAAERLSATMTAQAESARALCETDLDFDTRVQRYRVRRTGRFARNDCEP